MRVETKKKALAEAVATVKDLAKALATGEGATSVHLVADDTTLVVRSVNGSQVIQSTVKDVKVETPGSAILDVDSLSSALAVGGDLLKLSKDGNRINFSLGRSKGTLQTLPGDSEDVDLMVKPTIFIGNLRAILKAIALKGNKEDRTLHFDGENLSVRGEATDSHRGLVVKLKLGDDSKLKHTASLSLPYKAMDSVANILGGEATIAFNESFFCLRAPGILLHIPQSSTPPLNVEAQMMGWLETQTKHLTFKVKVSGIVSALKDAVAMAPGDGQLALAISGQEARLVGNSDVGEIETTFDIEADKTLALKAVILPAFLRECLDFYRMDEVNIGVFDQCLVIDADAVEGGLDVQTSVCPFYSPVVLDKKQPKAEKKAAAPVEDDEDAEEPVVETPKAKKAKTPEPEANAPEAVVEKPKKTKTPEPEATEPTEKPKKAPKPEAEAPKPEVVKPTKARATPLDDEDDEEVVVKKPAPVKPKDDEDEPAPKPKAKVEPKAPPKEEEADDEDEDEEEFDDDE